MIPQALKIRHASGGSVGYFELTGVIDESFTPAPFISRITTAFVILNLKGVERLTSFGVREWTSGMRDLANQSACIYFHECSPAFVTQLNAVTNFGGNARVLSILAPYFCETCDLSRTISVGVAATGELLSSQPSCEKCSGKLELDEDPRSYFASFKERAVASSSLEPVVAAFLRGVEEGNVSLATLDGSPQSLAQRAPSNVRRVTQPPAPDPAARSSHARTWPSPKARMVAALGIWGALMAGVLLKWFSESRGLRQAEAAEYQRLVEEEKFREAKAIVEAAAAEGRLGPAKVKELYDEITSRALVPYGQNLVDGKYDSASAEVAHLIDEGVLPTSEGPRLQRTVVKMALDKYRELAQQRQYADAEHIVQDLERTLPGNFQGNLSQEVEKERMRLRSAVRHELLRAYKEGQWEKVLEASSNLQLFGPLDEELSGAVAESTKQLHH